MSDANHEEGPMGRKYYKPYKSKKHGHYGHGGGVLGALLSALSSRRHYGGDPYYHRPHRPSFKQSIISAILRRIFRKF
jgi:hypothetical protein